MSSLVIVIDVLNIYLPEQTDTVAQSIVDFCKSEEVSAVALASYGNKIDYAVEVQADQPFFQNSQLFFCDETQSDTIRTQWKALTKVPTSFTHKTIANMPLRHNQVGFIALTSLQILWYCNNINPDIDKIYVTGLHFGECLHFRNVGLIELNALKNAQMFKNTPTILVRSDCTLSNTGPCVFDDKYEQVDGTTYKYIG